jgi:integrase
MATTKLTDGYVDGLAADGRDQVIWDAELRRFGLRLTPAGKKIYIVQYRAKPAPGIPSTTRKSIIGEHDGRLWNVTKARAQARRVLGAVDAGGDPVAERKAKAETERLAEAEARATAALAAEEAEARERDRFEAVVERYVAAVVKKRKSGGETARHLRREPVEAWTGRHVSAIRRREVVDLLDALRERSPATARLTYSALRGLFGWCVEREILTASPCDYVTAPPRPAARDRVLADDELRAVWLGAKALGHPFGPILKLLILTGQREAEVAGMTRAEIDLNAATWTIPKERTKNGREHVVDLSPQALAIVNGVPNSGDLLFPARNAAPRKHSRKDSAPNRRPVVGFSAAKRLLDGDVIRKTKEALPTAALAPWRIHDLRRTAATGMAGMGIAPHVIERVLNHVSGVTGGLVGVYQRHEYRAERKAAVAAWGARVEAIVTGQDHASNVRQLRP